MPPITAHSKLTPRSINLRDAIYQAHEGTCFFTGKLVSLEKSIVVPLFNSDNAVDSLVLTSSEVDLSKYKKTAYVSAAVARNRSIYVQKVVDIYNSQFAISEICKVAITISKFLDQKGVKDRRRRQIFWMYIRNNRFYPKINYTRNEKKYVFYEFDVIEKAYLTWVQIRLKKGDAIGE